MDFKTERGIKRDTIFKIVTDTSNIQEGRWD
jgi:hypothetical protein